MYAKVMRAQTYHTIFPPPYWTSNLLKLGLRYFDRICLLHCFEFRSTPKVHAHQDCDVCDEVGGD